MSEPLLDANAAGELLGVPASWVLRQARANRIPHVRLGHYVRFERVALEAWWRSRLQGPLVTDPGARSKLTVPAKSGPSRANGSTLPTGEVTSNEQS